MASKKSADAVQQEKIAQFMSVTGTDNERALFYLQASAWNVESAMSAFFDNSEPSHGGDAMMPVQETQAPDPMAVPDHPPLPMEDVQPRPQRGGFATLSDYREQPASSLTEDKGQEFFAGGSEHSGQMIEGPPKKKLSSDSMAKEVFESAKKHGAVSIEEEEKQRKKGKPAFRGSGFKLGDSEGPSVHIPGGPLPQSPEKVRHMLTFWKNGFSVDDRELRNGESEADKAFIQSVSRGEIPQELISSAKGGEVDIDLQDRRTENYVKPKRKVVAFSGEGHKLGGLAPEVVTDSTLPSMSAPPTANTSSPSVPLDPTQPTTNIQIRLADGSRLVAKFNHSHTVNDIRQYINLCRPSSSVYALMTTFPNRELTDPTQTLAEAKLLNAVVVQRMK